MRGRRGCRIFAAGAASIVFAGYATLPKVSEKPVSMALAKPPTGPLAESSALLAKERARTHSSVLLLEGGLASVLRPWKADVRP